MLMEGIKVVLGLQQLKRRTLLVSMICQLVERVFGGLRRKVIFVGGWFISYKQNIVEDEINRVSCYFGLALYIFEIYMPKHEGPIRQLIDPFSIPAQMNNLGVFIVAYVTKQIYEQDTCTDTENIQFLNFIFYGSAIVVGGTALLSVLYMVGLLDYCINKVMPCGQVCLTLNTLSIFLAGLLYHFIATIYGLYVFLWGTSSVCVELQMFKQITCAIYFCWFSFIVLYILVKSLLLCRKKEIPSVEESYTQLK